MDNNVDHNTYKWTAFCRSEQDADQLLHEKVLLISQKKLVVSAKKQLVESKKKYQDLSIYKFIVITAPKNS